MIRNLESFSGSRSNLPEPIPSLLSSEFSGKLGERLRFRELSISSSSILSSLSSVDLDLSSRLSNLSEFSMDVESISSDELDILLRTSEALSRSSWYASDCFSSH